MRKSSTVHLEESTWDDIEEYRKDYSLSSRNDAIERIITEWRVLKGVKNRTVEQELVSITDKDNKEDNSAILDSVNNAFKDMPD